MRCAGWGWMHLASLRSVCSADSEAEEVKIT